MWLDTISVIDGTKYQQTDKQTDKQTDMSSSVCKVSTSSSIDGGVDE